MSSNIALTFRCSFDFYQYSIQGFNRIAALLTSMLKTLESTKSKTRPGKGGVGIGGDGGDDDGHDNGATSSMLRTSLSTDSSTSATQIAVEYDGADGGGGKWVEELSKVEKPQKPEESQKSLVQENVYRNTGPTSMKNSSFR